MHENRFHSCSSFITLTFADEHLPPDGSLNVKVFQDFMKRLRRSLPRSKKIRFFHCGEYGEKFGRPHYHALIFGLDFVDCGYAKETDDKTGVVTWQSRTLDRLWPFGMNRVGEVTFESCAYVARYITKKVSGRLADAHYQFVNDKGEIFKVAPEYCTMSRRPGIGALHFDKYSNEIYLRDEVISRGHPCKPPKFYDRLLAKQNSALYESVKEQRECALMLSPALEKSPARLHVREVVKLALTGQLRRKYEDG